MIFTTLQFEVQGLLSNAKDIVKNHIYFKVVLLF